ncbi:MAG: hypothetical protein IPP22_10600 [Nitrosomonas sp.]|nr:hypothetical protein [Nitrosomonas sp.]
MAAKPKLTTEEWAKVRNTWESDPREGYAWLVESMALPVSAPGVRKVSLRDKWKKSEKPSKPTKTPKETSKLKTKKQGFQGFAEKPCQGFGNHRYRNHQ